MFGKKKHKKRLNNKAFTLVEIILAVALLAAASVSIGGIIMSTQNTSNQMLSEQDLQQQLVEMQQTVHNETLQTNAGIKYWVKEQGKDTYSLVLNDGDTSTPGQESLYDEKVIAYYNLNREDYILEKKYYVYDVEEKTIKTSTSTLNLPINDETKRKDIVMKMDDNIEETLLNITDWSILAKNVSNWSVDLQHYHKNRLISYNIELIQDGMKYPTEETVYVRNDIAVNGDLTLDKYDTLKVPKPYIDEFDFYYNGTIQGPSLKNYNERYWMLSGTTVTLAKNVGTYEITFVPKDGTVWDNGSDIGSEESITYTWNIFPKSIGVSWGELSWPYDGKQHSTTCVISSGIIGEDVCGLVLSNNLVGPDVGEKVVTVETTNPNYKVQKQDASKTIKIVQSVVRVNWLEKSWEYCKSIKSPKYTLTSDQGIVGKVDLVFDDGSIGPDVGKKIVTYHLSNQNYKLENNTVELEIYPKTAILQWNEESWTYDNKTHSTTCVVINLEPGDVCSVTLSGNSVGPDVGSQTVRAERLSNPNYKLSDNGETKQISINKLIAELEWGNTTWTYNGSPRYATCIIKNAPAGSVYKLEIPGNGITNAGNKTVSVLLKEGSKNFTLPNNRTRTLIMNPKPVSLLWGKTEWDYDGYEHSTTCEVNPNDIVNRDSVYPYLIRNYVGPAVGDTRTVEATGLSNSNYIISTKPGVEKTKTLRILAPKYPTLRWNDTWYTNGTNYPKSNITKITLKDSGVPSSYNEKWDASQDNDSTVTAYRSGTEITIVGNGSGKIYANRYSSYAFSNFTNAIYIDLSILDTSNANSMAYMFYQTGKNSINLEIKGLDSWDTSNVTNMSWMFANVGNYTNRSGVGTEATSGKLIISNLTKWDVSKVTNMKEMFYFCGSDVAVVNIGKLDSWNVSNVTDMSNMFHSFAWNSPNLFIGNLSEWKVGNVKNMDHLFAMGSHATSIDLGNLSSWDVSNVTTMESMFESMTCYSPKATKFYIGDLSGWNTSNVTNMSRMFADIFTHTKIQNLSFDIGNIGNWDVSNVTNMSFMFSNAGLQAQNWYIGDLSNWDTSSVQYAFSLFEGAGGASKTATIGNLSTKTVKNNGNTYVAWNMSNVISMSMMFHHALPYTFNTIGDISTWDVSKATNMWAMFEESGRYCQNWNIGNLGKWDVCNVTDMSNMFKNAGQYSTTWTIGHLDNWNVQNVTQMQGMFAYAGQNSEEWDIGDLSKKIVTAHGKTYTAWDTSNVQKFGPSDITFDGNTFSHYEDGMFLRAGEYAKTWNVGDISNWNVSSAQHMSLMFYKAGYKANYHLNLSNWKVRNVQKHYGFSEFVSSKITEPRWG